MIVAQRYELGAALGAGGEARVFRAHDQVSGREVAVRLSAEAMADLTPTPTGHPGWVRLLDRGVDGDHGAYAVFELLQGMTLDELVAVEPLQPAPWLAFVRQSLTAVGALHAAGWTHGDLNAGNFLLHDGATWKLLELPFLHAPRPALFGSIHTLAPEQIDGRPPGPRSDLYALGCLYYYAAVGSYPHAGGTPTDIAISRLRFPPEPLHERAPTLPPGHAGWVTSLLALRPEERPPDAAAAHQLLERTR